MRASPAMVRAASAASFALSNTARASMAARCAWSTNAFCAIAGGRAGDGVGVGVAADGHWRRRWRWSGVGGGVGAAFACGGGAGGAGVNAWLSSGWKRHTARPSSTTSNRTIAIARPPRRRGGVHSGGRRSSLSRSTPPRRGAVACAAMRWVGASWAKGSETPNSARHSWTVCGRWSGAKASALSMAARNGRSKRSAWVLASGR